MTSLSPRSALPPVQVSSSLVEGVCPGHTDAEAFVGRGEGASERKAEREGGGLLPSVLAIVANGRWLVTFSLANEDTRVLFKYVQGCYVEDIGNVTQGGGF